MRKRYIVAVVTALGIVMGLSLLYFRSDNTNSQQAASTTATSTPSSEENPSAHPTQTSKLKPLAPDEASFIEEALNSGNLQEQARGLVPEIRDAYIKTGKRFPANGTTLLIVRETFTQTDNAAVVQAKLSDGSTVILFFARSTDRHSWLVFDYQEVV